MQHFFVTPDQVCGEKIYIEGSDVNHMKNVLRMKMHRNGSMHLHRLSMKKGKLYTIRRTIQRQTSTFQQLIRIRHLQAI